MTKLVLALFLCSVEVLYKDNVAAIVAEALSFIKYYSELYSFLGPLIN